jgi:hypothetical protein
MMKSMSAIVRSAGSRPLDTERGFIANSSDSLLLMTVIMNNSVSGLSLFRRDTIVSIEESEITQLVRRALLLRGCVVPDFIDLPVQSLTSAMEWLMTERLICGVYQEAEGADFANFGKIVDVADDAFTMHEIEPSGRWDVELTKYNIVDCTRITFLGEYESSLARYSLDAGRNELGGIYS